MATRNIVPRATGEGGIGTSAKKWGAFYALLAYIEGGTISGADITVGSGKTLNVSGGTLTLANDQISGDKIHGGTISAFASTGIDDNADAVAITIDSNENIGIGCVPVNKLDVEGAVAIGAAYSGTYTAPTNGLIVEGNVGIGTASPSYPLDVVNGAIRINDLAGYGNAILRLESTHASLHNYQIITGSIGFQIRDSTVSETTSGNRIVISNNGNVGIGCTPVNKLDVEGAVAIGAAYSGTSTAPTNGLIVEGNVGIGTASPGGKLHVYGSTGIRVDAADADQVGYGWYKAGTQKWALFTEATTNELKLWNPSTSQYPIMFYANNNTALTTLTGTGNRAVYSDANGVLTNSSSDQSLKTNVTAIPYGLSQALALNPIKFNWTSEASLGDQPEIGFIAQEVQAIIPEVIGTNSNGLLSLDYPKLTAVLCKAIQELNQKLEDYINGKL